ncbi:four helix bundle protein [Pirellulimonas nuda]|uniref:four helix bundle protein n=1 Tax=Pirellulimonas nuda TaxID=2528009 RepID=UPI0011A1D102|nr:four helix bundle protein [Pirellulimonas nuda]
MDSYRDLKVWQAGIALSLDIYRATKQLPKEELYGLVSQMRRAAVSIPSNVAEGHARGSTPEFLRFLAIARGSLAELETQLIIATRLELLRQDSSNEILHKADELSRMLSGLRTSLQKRLPQK